MKKVLGVILGGLLLLPVVSNAADAQKAADNKKPRSTPGPVKISWLWTNPSSQLQLVLLKR